MTDYSQTLEDISTSLQFIANRLADGKKAQKAEQEVLDSMTDLARDMRDVQVQAAAQQKATPRWWNLAWNLYAQHPGFLSPYQSISRAKGWLIVADRQRFSEDYPECLPGSEERQENE